MEGKIWALALVVSTLGLTTKPFAQEPASLKLPPGEEVGIDERLGDKISLDVTLKDEDGNDVTLRHLIDKPTILTLNYFSCAGICTPLLNGVLDVVNKIRLEPAKDFQVITVSFDPRDTPEIATRKRENYIKLMKRQYPPQGWRFLTGEAAATRQVTDSVGFKFRAEKREDGRVEYVHAGALVLLSPEGMITRYVYGTTYLPSDLEMAIGEAKRGEVRPTVSKLLRFCFSYDPESKRYVFDITKVAGFATLFLVAVFVVFVLLRGKVAKSRSRT